MIMEAMANVAALLTGKRRRSEQEEEEQEREEEQQVQEPQETKENDVVIEEEKQEEEEQIESVAEEKAPSPPAATTSDALETLPDEESDEESDGEEALVVLELCDFKNHPLFDDYSSAVLEGIDTAKPTLKIGEYLLHGQLEETVGTSYFYDTDTSRVPDKTYQFAGQTIKKIKFTIAPPEEP